MATIANLFTSLFSLPTKSAHLKTVASPLSLSVATNSPANHPQSLSLSIDGNQQHHHQPLSKTTGEVVPDDVLMSVVCPSLACANTLFFKSAYNVQVIVEDNEQEEKLVNRFRREVMKAGVIQECKRRRFFENKQAEKKRKTREAAKRNRKRRFIPRPVEKEELSKNKKEDEEKDNWELPDEALPY